MYCKIIHIRERLWLYIAIIAVSLSMFSCSITKHVPDGEYLLADVKYKVDNSSIDLEDLETTLRQKPNRKVFGIKFYLLLHNSVNAEREKKREDKRKVVESEMNTRRKAKGKPNRDKFYLTRWLLNIGEAPVIHDQFATDKTVANMKSYLQSQSYYDAEVNVTTKTKRKKIFISYDIKASEPWVVSNILYDVTDPYVLNLLKVDSVNSLVHTGDNFNTDILQTERERLVRMMKTKGYYYFTVNNVHFYADTTLSSHETILTVAVRKSFSEKNIADNEPFRTQVIRNVYIYSDYDAKLAIDETGEYLASLDTMLVDDVNIIYSNKLMIKPSVFLQSCFLKPGEVYNIENVEKTHSHISNLKQFKLINVKFNASEDVFLDTQKEKYLDVHIYLTPMIKQSYTLELEGNNTSGNVGMAGGISYNNKNLARGAQIFSVKGSLAFQTIKADQGMERSLFFNTLEYGGEMKLNIPKLMIPFWENYEFVKNHNPKTQISASFNYQKRPDYTRSISSVTFGYFWKGGKNKYITHFVNPIELYSVKIFDFNPQFQQQIENLFIKYSYQDQLLTVMSYDLVFNNQSLTKTKSFSYLYFNIETSGNLPSLAYKAAKIEPVDGSYKFMGVEFAQFIKADLDYRFYQVFDRKQSLVYRGYIGVGLPYGNSTAGLPFIKKYFIGGANDMRAWHVRSIGPGSYSSPNRNFDQIGDMKLMLNLEYRFPLISFLNGAIFLDAGNIWAIDKNDNRAGALFEFSRFYNEIAVGTGFGTRIDLSFFIIRFDFGIPLRDPTLPLGERWFGSFEKLEFRDFTFNFGIGYPF